jgi:hypothetical protein
MVRRMRAVLQYVDRIAAGLLVLVGAYLVYYGIYALDTDNASSTGVSVIDDWSSRTSAWLQDGGTTLGWVFAALVVAGLAWAAMRRRAKP